MSWRREPPRRRRAIRRGRIITDDELEVVQDEAGAEAAGATDEGEKEGEEDEEEEEEANEAALEAREIKWHLPEGLKVCNKPLLVLDDSLVGCLIFMRWKGRPTAGCLAR